MLNLTYISALLFTFVLEQFSVFLSSLNNYFFKGLNQSLVSGDFPGHLNYLWSSNRFSASNLFASAFQGLVFSKSRFFRVQLFQIPRFSDSRFFLGLIFQGPGFRSSGHLQITGKALEYEQISQKFSIRNKGLFSTFKRNCIYTGTATGCVL